MNWFVFLCFLIVLVVHVCSAADSNDVVDQQMTWTDFETHVDHHPQHCYVCDNILFPMTSAFYSKVFTCDHGHFVHSHCVGRLFAALDQDKLCPHANCDHAPLVNPQMHPVVRSNFYNIYKSLQNGGACAACHQPLYRTGMFTLRNSAEQIKVCGDQYFHHTCAHRGGSICANSAMQTQRISLEGYLGALPSEQFHRLDSYYTSLLLRSDFTERRVRRSRNQPLRVTTTRPNHYRRSFVPQITNGAFTIPSSLRVEHSPIAQLKLNYDTAIREIQEADAEDKKQSNVCTICLNAIQGDKHLPASTQYMEELEKGEQPTDHFQHMHLVCLQYALAFKPTCPVCRRNVLPLES